MIDLSISESEKKCIRLLAKTFLEGGNWCDETVALLEKEGISEKTEQYRVVLSMMEEYEAITNVTHSSEGRFRDFTITPKIVILARELDRLEQQAIIEAAKPRDIVSEVTTKVRGHPWLAWGIIVFYFVTAALTSISQTVQLLNTIGVLNLNKQPPASKSPPMPPAAD